MTVWLFNSAAIMALHQPDRAGRCAYCIRVGLQYDRSDPVWPCGAYCLAQRDALRAGRRRAVDRDP
jgi:hypothetical protein